jgi:membrane dipeptidase
VILDGHNDLALRVWRGQGPPYDVELGIAESVGFSGGFFALAAPGGPFKPPTEVPYAVPLDDPVPFEQARKDVGEMATALEGLDVAIVRTVHEIRPGRVNAIMHIEGAEALAPDLSDLEAWYERGLRSVGIVWSRPNAFAEGVPFRFPGSPDTGPGLTRAGRDLVHACNLSGIMVDVSHLNEAGFWDVVQINQAPMVATHSNAHAICASTRNLTDRQLGAIGDSGGVVGINFAAMFLREDGGLGTDVPLTEIVRHIDYIASRIGVDHVAFGSDFDGAETPDELGGIAGLPRLVELLRSSGYGEADLDKITHGNWLRVLDATWNRWGRYFERASLDPRPTLLEAVQRFAEPGLAVDLGAGTGRDTLELVRRGWRVVSIDGQQEAIDRIRALVGEDDARLETRVGKFEEASWPRCDLLNASFSLPFCPPELFPGLWQRIVGSIVPGGRFAGQFFGERDDWARTGLAVQTRTEVEALLEPFEVELFDEFDGEGPTAIGKTKHWHVFHAVARKR